MIFNDNTNEKLKHLETQAIETLEALITSDLVPVQERPLIAAKILELTQQKQPSQESTN